jgi:hypothetical protein
MNNTNMTPGVTNFWDNAAGVLRDISMLYLDLAHGAAIDAVRWCLLVRSRPTHHRQTLLEQESPALLAYLEKLAASGEAEGWRSLEERIRLHAEVLRESSGHPCKSPWLAAIWHCLPELAALGQSILDRQAAASTPSPALSADGTRSGTGGDSGDKGSGKAGSAAVAKPRPGRRFMLPAVTVTPTITEKRLLDLGDGNETDDPTDDFKPGGADGPDGTDGPAGPKGPGGTGGPK